MGEPIPTEEQTQVQKSEWLERLEQESWQAELIISGLALYGLFMVPPYINSIADYLIKNLSPDEYFLGYMIMVMAYLGISILCGFFVIHFVLRSFWIGLIGLNSVYPNGYGEGGGNGFYSKYFVKKSIERIPRVLDTIKSLDNTCSTMFATAFMVSMIYASFFIVFSVAMVISRLLADFEPSWIAMLPFYLLAGSFLFVMIVMSIAGHKKYHENEKVQEYYFQLSKYWGYMAGTFFTSVISQIGLTFYSNQKTKTQGMGVGLTFMLLSFVLYTYFLTQSNTFVLIDGDVTQTEEVQSIRMENNYYENMLNKDLEILNPVIASDQIKGDFLKVFIPVFDSEDKYRDNFCEEYVDNEEISWDENRKLKGNHRIRCMQKYHQVYVNDSLYQVAYVRFRHPNNQEYGIATYIPTNAFKIGRNDLKIYKLKEPNGETFRKDFIPFWFAR